MLHLLIDLDSFVKGYPSYHNMVGLRRLYEAVEKTRGIFKGAMYGSTKTCPYLPPPGSTSCSRRSTECTQAFLRGRDGARYCIGSHDYATDDAGTRAREVAKSLTSAFMLPPVLCTSSRRGHHVRALLCQRAGTEVNIYTPVSVVVGGVVVPAPAPPPRYL